MRWGTAAALVVVAYFVGAGATPVHAEDPPVVNTVTINEGQTRTFTVSAPSDRVQCHPDYQEDKGSYCLQTKAVGPGSGSSTTQNISASVAPRYYACSGPFSLAPTTRPDGSTITYAQTDADGWIGWGGHGRLSLSIGPQPRNDAVEMRGLQMRVTGVGVNDTPSYLTVTLYGTQRV